jgi:hypothetical protein
VKKIMANQETLREAGIPEEIIEEILKEAILEERGYVLQVLEHEVSELGKSQEHLLYLKESNPASDLKGFGYYVRWMERQNGKVHFREIQLLSWYILRKLTDLMA